FVGDSITKTFGNYVQSLRKGDESILGTAQFVGTISMSASTASKDQVAGDINFRYRGRSMALTDALTAMEAKKAFVMLGVNDIGGRRWEKVEESFARIIDNIHEKCPGVEVILFGILPVSRSYCREHKLNIERWNSFNPILEGICREHGAEFISFADQVMTAEGYLDNALSDGQFHLNQAGEDLWIRFLRRYAAQRLYPDAIIEN
ncbi:MAG: SGNH/GDSL hydrolase family protein, partial [Clostridia bacterium]|nr:SGNH/GDSL hydrolase family protein [Clostridia bacterium]